VVVKLTVIVVVIFHREWERGKAWKGDGKRNRRVWGLVWYTVRLRIEGQTGREVWGLRVLGASVLSDRPSQIKFRAF
jgi:hypothetical protein